MLGWRWIVLLALSDTAEMPQTVLEGTLWHTQRSQSHFSSVPAARGTLQLMWRKNPASPLGFMAGWRQSTLQVSQVTLHTWVRECLCFSWKYMKLLIVGVALCCFALRRWYDTHNHKPAFILICHSFGLKYYLSTSFPPQMTRFILGYSWHMPSLPKRRKPHCFPPFPRGLPSALTADQVWLGTSSSRFSRCSSYLNLSQVVVGQFLLRPHLLFQVHDFSPAVSCYFFQICSPYKIGLADICFSHPWLWYCKCHFPYPHQGRGCFWHQSCSSQTGLGLPGHGESSVKPSWNQAVPKQ